MNAIEDARAARDSLRHLSGGATVGEILRQVGEAFDALIAWAEADEEVRSAERLSGPTDQEREVMGESALHAYLASLGTAPRPWSQLPRYQREAWIAAALAGYRRQGPITDAIVSAALDAGGARMAELTGELPWEPDDTDRDAMRAALEAVERAR